MRPDRQIAMVLDRHIRGRDGFGVERLADIAGLARGTIHHHCAAEAAVPAWTLLVYVAAVGTDEPSRALAMWRDLSELVGMEAHLAARRSAPNAILADGIGFQAEVGDFARALADATAANSPGGPLIVAEEIPAIRRELREAVLAGELMDADCRGVPSPQMSLAAVRP